MNRAHITIAELNDRSPESYILLDMRDEYAYQNGHIPTAVHHPGTDFSGLPSQSKTIILYCRKGEISAVYAEKLRETGYLAHSLSGGYMEWLMTQLGEDKSPKIEESIRKKFHKKIFSRFTKAVKTYQLLKPGDRIAVCISGGKDSMLLAKLFQELTRHRQIFFELVFLAMDPGYAAENRALLERNANTMGIPLTLFETDIFDSVYQVPKSACYLCARMRRGHLYAKAQALGCNKIALGHHYDDVIETILMGMLYGSQIQTMMPKLHSSNYAGMELIRPMYLIRETDIKHFRDYHDLHFLQCACRFTDCSMDGSKESKRTEIKKLISTLKACNPYVEGNIFASVENVHLDAILAYKKDGKKIHFLDHYEDLGG